MFVDTISRLLLSDEKLIERLNQEGKVECNITLKEEPGEILATLLMTERNIVRAVEEATQNVFGSEAVVTQFCLSHYKNELHFTVCKK